MAQGGGDGDGEVADENFKEIIKEASKKKSTSIAYYGFDVNGKDSPLYEFRQDVTNLIIGQHIDIINLDLPSCCSDNFIADCLASTTLFSIETKLDLLVKSIFQIVDDLTKVRIHPTVLRNITTHFASRLAPISKRYRTLMLEDVMKYSRRPSALDLGVSFFLDIIFQVIYFVVFRDTW